SPDGRWLATGSPDGLRLWDAVTSRELRTLPGTENVTQIAFAPNGRLALATASSVRVWDASDLVPVSPTSSAAPAGGPERLPLASRSPAIQGLAFSPDGCRLAASISPDQLKVWDSATGKQVLEIKGQTRGIQGLAYSPDGRLLAASTQQGRDPAGR